MGDPKNLTGPGDQHFGQWDCPFCPNGGPNPDTGARVHVDQGHLVLACSNCRAQVRFGADILRRPDLDVIKAYPALCRELYGTAEMDMAVAELLHAEAEGSPDEVENARSLYLTTVENAKRELLSAQENDDMFRRKNPARKGMNEAEVDAKIEAAIKAARKEWEAEQKKK